MECKESSDEVDAAAAGWVARIDRASLSEIEKAAFNAWLDKDARHRGAFMRAQAILVAAEGALHSLEKSKRPLLSQNVRVSRRQLTWLGGATAALAISVVFGLSFDESFVTYHAKRGEVLLQPMGDGSVVTLNTDTEIVVRFSKTKREVHLIKGEALFDVAKDLLRPFIVNMGDTSVRAVGTKFVVRNLENEPIQVLVGEGAVEMYRETSKQESPIRVRANERAVALDVPVPSVKILDSALDPSLVLRELAWREGKIAFEGNTLKQAAAEFGRYSDVVIVIDDPRVANLRVTGLFSAHNPIAFARSVAATFNLKIDVTPGKVMLWP